jgi:predicted Zn-dependent protease
LTKLGRQVDYRRAVAAVSYKDYAEARKITLAIIKETPSNVKLYTLLINIEILSGQYKEAEKLIEQTKSINSDPALINLLNAKLATNQQQPEKAAQFLQLEWDRAYNDQVASSLYQNLKKFDKVKAAAFLKAWQSKSPKSTSAQLYNAIAIQIAGDASGAINAYETLLEQNENNITALNNLAWLLHENNDERALPYAERAFKFAPNSASVLDTLGWILYKQGQTAKGKSMIEKAGRIAPTDPSIQEHLKEIQKP